MENAQIVDTVLKLQKSFINQAKVIEIMYNQQKKIAQVLCILIIINIIFPCIFSIMGLCLAHNQVRIQEDFDDYLESQQEIEWINSLPEDYED